MRDLLQSKNLILQGSCDFFSLLCYALHSFQPLLQMGLGFYRQLSSTSQQSQSRTILAQKETYNIGNTAYHHIVRDNSNTESV